jgi:hypothetical protein
MQQQQPPRIVNVGILDDKEPLIFVQVYIYPDRNFQVFRKPTSPDEVFTLSQGIEVDRDLYWNISTALFDTAADLAEDDLPELFALVYFDEENPPFYPDMPPDPPEDHVDSEDPIVETPMAQEQMCVAYDPEAKCYECSNTFEDYDGIDDISAPSLDEALAIGIDRLNAIVSKTRPARKRW